MYRIGYLHYPRCMRREDVGYPITTKCLALQCARLHRFVTGMFDNALSSIGITAAQLSVLMTIREAGATTASQLRTLLHMDRSTVSKHIKWLREHELVTVEEHVDRRCRVVSLTEAGRRKVRSAHPGWRRAQNRVMDLLSSSTGPSMPNVRSVIIQFRSPRPERRRLRAENYYREDR